MPIGVRTFDELGRVLFDSTTRVGRVMGTIVANPAGGSISDANLAQGTPFAFAIPSGDIQFAGNPMLTPVCTINGTTITYGASNIAFLIMYGVY